MRPEIGDEVRVQFIDHCSIHGDAPYDLITCVVRGEVIEADDLKLVVRSWEAVESTQNDEVFVIHTRTIVGWWKLEALGEAREYT